MLIIILNPPCQPTIATQLLLDGGKIEPYTIKHGNENGDA
jgi:hypothetical protein